MRYYYTPIKITKIIPIISNFNKNILKKRIRANTTFLQ